jgi:hypothetical protein
VLAAVIASRKEQAAPAPFSSAVVFTVMDAAYAGVTKTALPRSDNNNAISASGRDSDPKSFVNGFMRFFSLNNPVGKTNSTPINQETIIATLPGAFDMRPASC